MVKKISIIGAGAVGSTLAFHLFSRLPLNELAIVDIVPGLAKGISLDIEDTRTFFNSTVKIEGTEDFSIIKNSDIVVFTAGVARKDGMDRSDLLRINAKVTKEVANKIKKYAPESIVITVTNPLDLITYIMFKETGFKRNRVIGMGSSLDSARLLNIIYQESGVGTSFLEAFVFGLHNNSMIMTQERIKIKGKAAKEFLSEEQIRKIQDKTAMRGGEIVSLLKNRSANFAPSFSCFNLIKAIKEGKNAIIPVSVFLNGEYGLSDLCMGVPCVINNNGIDKIIELELNKEEKDKIKKAIEAFKEINDI